MAFIWLLGIWTKVLMLVQQMLLHSESSLQANIFISDFSLFQYGVRVLLPIHLKTMWIPSQSCQAHSAWIKAGLLNILPQLPLISFRVGKLLGNSLKMFGVLFHMVESSFTTIAAVLTKGTAPSSKSLCPRPFLVMRYFYCLKVSKWRTIFIFKVTGLVPSEFSGKLELKSSLSQFIFLSLNLGVYS